MLAALIAVSFLATLIGLMLAWVIYVNRDSALPEQMQLAARAEIDRDDWKLKADVETKGRKVAEDDRDAFKDLYKAAREELIDAKAKQLATASRDDVGRLVDELLQKAGTPPAPRGDPDRNRADPGSVRSDPGSATGADARGAAPADRKVDPT